VKNIPYRETFFHLPFLLVSFLFVAEDGISGAFLNFLLTTKSQQKKDLLSLIEIDLVNTIVKEKFIKRLNN
jgi:hypothetical protein